MTKQKPFTSEEPDWMPCDSGDQYWPGEVFAEHVAADDEVYAAHQLELQALRDRIAYLETAQADAKQARRDALQEAACEARRYSESYKQGSDGRNTFILLAENLEARAALMEADT